MSQLRAESYERIQFEGESYANYVQSNKDAVLVLRIRENEAQVVELTIECLTPTQRARFVFQAPNSSFLQLETLAMVDRNISYADQTRAAQPAGVNISAIESPPAPEKTM